MGKLLMLEWKRGLFMNILYSYFLFNEFTESLENFKLQLTSVVPVPIQDQILLIGPPFKVLDRQVRLSNNIVSMIVLRVEA